MPLLIAHSPGCANEATHRTLHGDVCCFVQRSYDYRRKETIYLVIHDVERESLFRPLAFVIRTPMLQFPFTAIELRGQSVAAAEGATLKHSQTLRHRFIVRVPGIVVSCVGFDGVWRCSGADEKSQ